MDYVQSLDLVSVTTPLGPNAFLLERLTGSEAISELFHFRLDLLAETTTVIAFEQVLGQVATVTFILPDGSQRFLSGIVNRFSQGGEIYGPLLGRPSFIRYRMEIVPQLWLLTRKVNSRIFQQLSVPEILAQVLTGLRFADQTQGTFPPRDYCVQYAESDFHFASRLMEEEGIYYYFTFDASGHQMVLANAPASPPPVPGPVTVVYDDVEGGIRTADRVREWSKTQEIRSGKYTLWDSCFELPGNNLSAEQPVGAPVAVGTVSHPLAVAGNAGFEIYHYPGEYAQRFDGVTPGGGLQAANLQNIFTDNVRTVAIRMQQESLPGLFVEGSGNCRHFTAGHQFALDLHFNANGSYVLTRVEHEVDLSATYFPSSRPVTEMYRNRFRCIPQTLPYVPVRAHAKPRIDGLQKAVVVGPPGQEIFTDQYGRVKVQFLWDRLGTNDANSSCWIRVATHWAGKLWGSVHIPRIGQEVVIDFLEGDPDQPLIVGSVYNAGQMPPYVLPTNMTQSGLKSRSTLQGTPDQFNELRFEDKKGSEEVYFHAEKDFTRIVENNDVLQVGYVELDGAHQSVDGSQTIKIYKDRTETLETGNETVTIATGSRTHSVKTDDSLTVQGKQTITITGDQAVTIQTGNRSVTISTGNDSTTLSAGGSKTTAMTSIVLQVGANSITIDQSGITLKGVMVSIEGEATLEAKSPMTTVEGDGMLTLKGGVTMIN